MTASTNLRGTNKGIWLKDPGSILVPWVSYWVESGSCFSLPERKSSSRGLSGTPSSWDPTRRPTARTHATSPPPRTTTTSTKCWVSESKPSSSSSSGSGAPASARTAATWRHRHRSRPLRHRCRQSSCSSSSAAGSRPVDDTLRARGSRNSASSRPGWSSSPVRNLVLLRKRLWKFLSTTSASASCCCWLASWMMGNFLFAQVTRSQTSVQPQCALAVPQCTHTSFNGNAVHKTFSPVSFLPGQPLRAFSNRA